MGSSTGLHSASDIAGPSGCLNFSREFRAHMILCGKPGLQFKCGEFTCILNDRFNIVLFTEHTVLRHGVFRALGFVVPVHYLSFIKTVNRKNGWETELSGLFTFQQPADAEVLGRYVAALSRDKAFAVIKCLADYKGPVARKRPASANGRVAKVAKTSTPGRFL